MKECSCCREERPFADFYARSGRPGKFLSHCKDCMRINLKRRRQLGLVLRNQYEDPAACRLRAQRNYDIKRIDPIFRQRQVEKKADWARRYPEQSRKLNVAAQKRARDELRDYRVVDALRRHSNLESSEIPQPLIDLKREHLRLVRQLRKKNGTEDSE